MIKSKHHWFVNPFLQFYVTWKINRNFHSFKIEGEVPKSDSGVLLICNHISWWDGIWTLLLNKKRFKKKYHFLMLEEMLLKNKILNLAGGYSIKKGSKSMVESLNYTAELLANKSNIVLFFPQGEIKSMHQTSFTFEKGIEKILQKIKTDIQVVFVANFIDYFSNVKPTLFSNITEFKGVKTVAEIEKQYNVFYTDCIEKQQNRKY